MNLNDYIMDLTQKRKDLLDERARHEATKQTAHDKIIEINAKIRRLDTIIAHAEEALKESEPETKEL
jgi:predicted ribosome quality control (RQC) complex YloA/Tae2 family protein